MPQPFIDVDNLAVRVTPWVDARSQHNSPLTAATLNTALGSIGGDKKTLLIAPGDWDINVPVSVPENVHLRFEAGARLQIKSGATLTIGGSIDAPLSQIFDMQGGTVVQSMTTRVAEIYPQWWGAVGDGTTNDTPAIQSALDFIGTVKPCTLFLTSGLWRIQDNNVTISELVYVRFGGGATLRVVGITVFMNGLFEAPIDQIFELQGTGRVKLGTREIRDIFPQWWGAKGNGSDDDTDAIQRALDAAADGIDSLKRRCVVLPENTYLVNSTLTIRSDLRGQSSSLTGHGAAILYKGQGACLRNITPYTTGMIIRNLKIDMRENTNDNVTGIHCQDGHVQGFFENVLVQYNPATMLKQYGIHIQPSTPQTNATSNQFINVGVENAEVGIQIGDNTENGQGGSNIISGGIILKARKAAIVLTGGQNAIIGGDHSVLPPSKVIHFSGGFDSQGNEVTGVWCKKNLIMGTTLDVFSGTASHYAIRINAAEGISDVFTAPSVEVLGAVGFVLDNDPRQRWVAVRTNAKVEAYRFEAKDTVEARAVKASQWVDAQQFFTKNIDALAQGNVGSLIGSAPGKALYVKPSGDVTPGSILLGTPEASYSGGVSSLPVTANGVTLLIGPDGRIYFGRLTAAGDTAVDIANMDSAGNLTLQGVIDANQLFTKNVDALASGNTGSLIGSAPGKALYVKPSGDVTPGSILLGTPEADYNGGISNLPVTANGVTLLVGPGGRIYFAKLLTGGNRSARACQPGRGRESNASGRLTDVGKQWRIVAVWPRSDCE